MRRTNLTRSLAIAVLAVSGVGLLAPVALAQQAGATARRAPSIDATKRENLMKMMRPVTIEFREQRLEDVITFIAELTGADLEPLWMDDRNSEGLDKDQPVSLRANRVTALKLLEMVLDQAAGPASFYSGGNTWQVTEWGAIQCGPKERLAMRRRVEVYPIDDMLFIIPDYDEAPEIDLQSVLQGGGGGGGGGQSPFRDAQQEREEMRPRSERAEEIIDILTALVEPEQWTTGGGASTMRYFQGGIIVSAPDFVHRQLNGYPWWPASAHSASMVQGRRYVGLTVDTQLADFAEFVNVPVTAVTGGGAGSPPPPGGGG